MKNNLKKYIAEAIGTCVLVSFGCGVAVISGDLVATAITFGLSIVAMAYAIGDISGCHINPAVSLAMLIAKKLNVKDFCGYVIAQIAGAFLGSGILYAILSSCNLSTANLGANAYGGDLNLSFAGAFLIESILTFVFIYTIFGVTSNNKTSHMGGIVIGLTLAFVHLLGIKLTGTSVNPARSIAPAVIMGGDALAQLPVFIIAPCVGAVLAACVFLLLNTSEKKK